MMAVRRPLRTVPVTLSSTGLSEPCRTSSQCHHTGY